MIEYLHDTAGENIAFFLNGQLWNRDGKHVGRFLVNQGIFINLDGKYIGEIYMQRLVYNKMSAYKDVSYGKQGSVGKIGRFTPMVNYQRIMLPMNYAEFDRSHLQ